jgi:hypothetical protein
MELETPRGLRARRTQNSAQRTRMPLSPDQGMWLPDVGQQVDHRTDSVSVSTQIGALILCRPPVNKPLAGLQPAIQTATFNA